jgi:hypothetical protein
MNTPRISVNVFRRASLGLDGSSPPTVVQAQFFSGARQAGLAYRRHQMVRTLNHGQVHRPEFSHLIADRFAIVADQAAVSGPNPGKGANPISTTCADANAALVCSTPGRNAVAARLVP